MRKRILSLVLAVLMLASALSITAFATDYAFGQTPADGQYKENDTIWLQSWDSMPELYKDLKWEYVTSESKLTCTKTEHTHTSECPGHWIGGKRGNRYVYDCGFEEHRHDVRRGCYTDYYQYKAVKKTDMNADSTKVYIAIMKDNSITTFPNEPTQSTYAYYFYHQRTDAMGRPTGQGLVLDSSVLPYSYTVDNLIDSDAFYAAKPQTRYETGKEGKLRKIDGDVNHNGHDLTKLTYAKDLLKNLDQTAIITAWLNATNANESETADQYKLLIYVIKNEQGDGADTPGWHIDCKVVKKTNLTLSYDENVPAEATRAYTKPANESVAPNTTCTVADMTPVDDNEKAYYAINGELYYFDGWNTKADGTGTAHAAGSKITLVDTDITLYAQWKAEKKYNLEYKFVGNVPDSTATPTDENDYYAGDSVTLQTVTAPDGYTFDGWYTNEACTIKATPGADGKWTFAAPAAGTTVTLYGKWTKQEAQQPDLTVTKTAAVQHIVPDINDGLTWSAPMPLRENEKVKVGEKITYTITVKNNTNQPISNVQITDTFNGKGSLTMEDTKFATLSQDEETGDYTITLKDAIEAGKSTDIKLTYIVQYGDTLLEEGKTEKELKNKAKVTYNGTEYPSEEVIVPVNTETFDLLVHKYWAYDYSAYATDVKVQLYANGTPVEGREKTIIKKENIGDNWTKFENLKLRDNNEQIIYSVKETAIDGAGEPYEVGNETKFDVKDANDKVIGTWTAEYTDTIKTNGHIQITNSYAPIDPITVTKTATVNGVEGATAKAGDTITYTITITNNANANQPIYFRDWLDINGSLTFANDPSLEIEDLGNGSYKSKSFTIKEGETITLTATYKVQVGDGNYKSNGEDGAGYYVKNKVIVYVDRTGGDHYEANATTKIEKDEDVYKIHVPIIKTLKNEGKDAFDGESFAFQIYTDYPDKMSHEWGHVIPSIYVENVAAGDSKTEYYKDAEGYVDYYSFTMTKKDFDDLPIDEDTNLPYVMIKERDEGTDKMTYDAKTYKLYLVPEKDSGSPSALLMALLTGEEVALPSNPVYDPAEKHTLYAIADLTKWKEERSTPYDCAVEFVNYYDKQEHKGDTVKVGPQLNRDDHVAYIMGYPDGNVRPEGEITRAEACTIFFRLLTEESRDYYFSKTNDYTDVKAGEWFNNAISTLSNAGIVTGYNDGTFRPNQPITRGEMAKIIANFANLNKGTKSFTDLSGHWSKTYVELAAGNGWIAGYPDGSFRPDQKITRAETVTMINRVLERVPAKESRLLSRSIMLTFPDNNPGDWYYIAMQEASNSHEYQRSVYETAGDEMWTKLIENVDWTKLER